MSLSKNIKYLRKKYKFSQEEIATMFGYKSYTTIQKWESGISEPSSIKINTLAELFQVDLNTLVNSDIEHDEYNPPVEDEDRGYWDIIKQAKKAGFKPDDLSAMIKMMEKLKNQN